MFGSTCAEQDAELAVAGEPRRLHEARLAAHVGLGAGDAGVEREVHDRGGDDDVLHGVAERRDDAHGQHEQRERHDGVGDAADDAVGPAAEEAGGDAGKPAHQEHQRDRGDRDEEVEPRRHDDAAEHVAAELVGAEPMLRRGWLQRGSGVARQRIVRNDVGADHAASTISTNRPKAKPVTRFSPMHIAAVPDQRGRPVDARGCRRRCRSCLEPHARVDQAVEDVDEQIERDIHHRHGQHEALQRREVGGDQRLDRKGADAGPGEHLLHQHVGAEQEREHHAERGDDRDHGVAESVGDDHRVGRQPAGARGAHEVGGQHRQHRGARHARDRREREDASVSAGRMSCLRLAQNTSQSPAIRLSIR